MEIQNADTATTFGEPRTVALGEKWASRGANKPPACIYSALL